ncbi:MAG: VanZ family protein [Pirellulales bacterium]|nr:VanZ family protein [Pirellulales bacterium]
MRIIRLLVCLSYAALLTVLLLSPDPAGMMGLKKAPLEDIGIHFSTLFLLAVLVHATRWPKPPHWTLMMFLAVYALAAEALQAIVPGRTVQLFDFIENLLGVSAGSGVYCFFQRKWNAWQRKKNERASIECE